jgi:hypothetical protein
MAAPYTMADIMKDTVVAIGSRTFSASFQEELHGKSDFLGLISTSLLENAASIHRGVKSTNLAVVVDELESAYSCGLNVFGKSSSKKAANNLVRTTAFFPSR